MKIKKSRGFTLIELLVVIAIIGILAAIVLVSLSGARDKAKDARITAALTQVRSQAELFYDDNCYKYAGDCGGVAVDMCADAQIDILEADMVNMGATNLVCVADPNNYCVSITNNDSKDMCVSSAGQVGDNACVGADTPCIPAP